jgi:hypothetical protein
VGDARTERHHVHERNRVVITMTEAEKEAVRRESRRILEERENPTRPIPTAVCEPVRVPEPQDPIAEWRDWHNARDAERQAAKAELRREERNARATQDLAGIDVRLAALEERMAAVEQAVASFGEVINGTVSFSNAATTKLHAVEALTERLDRTLDTLKTTHAREVDHLRNRLATCEAQTARESNFLGQQLNAARREIDALNGKQERIRDREQYAKAAEGTVVEVQALRRDLAERNELAAGHLHCNSEAS